MALGTFGAIVQFAVEMEKQAAQFYEQAARGRLAETFGELAGESRKRQDRLERARTELVAEMILESITGLDDADYRVEMDPNADEAGLIGQAQALEETAARFYKDAADKMPIREVVRLFERLLRENEKRRAKLA
jgi:rubrerythrin